MITIKRSTEFTGWLLSVTDSLTYFRDRHFILAIVLAIIVWGFMWWMGMGREPFRWALDFPRAFLLSVVVYPVLEEMAFRGFIQSYLLIRPGFQKRFYGLSRANIVTSFLFVALHFVNHLPLWALSVMAPSLIFGYFRDRYQSVIPAILLHCFYNAGYFSFFVSTG